MSQKVALITAASQGMGKACAEELASRGYFPVLMARSEEVHAVARKIGGIGFQGSVDNPEDLENFVELVLNDFGRIDVLVNNTGHPPKGKLIEITDDQWMQGANLVLMNVIRMARLVTPIMVHQAKGSIINISTFSALEPSLSFPVSSVFRAGLASYVKLFSQEFGSKGLRMNNILPGFIESYPASTEIIQQIPMARQGTLEEIAKTVAFLASDDAGYINGENIKVDGGITKHV